MLKSKCQSFLQQTMRAQKSKRILFSLYSTMPEVLPSGQLREACDVILNGIGSLDDLEESLNRFMAPFTSSDVTQIIDCCRNEAPIRRLLRFFSWSRKSPDAILDDKDFNHVIRVLAEKKDHTTLSVLISDLKAEGRAMEAQTYAVVADTLVNLGQEDEALGVFKNLDKFKCPQDSVTISAIVNALCAKGHARKAEGVVWHHKKNISGAEPCIYKSILHGWCVKGNLKEARRVLREMRSFGIVPDLFCYSTFLRGLCKRNLKFNPSGLVPEAFNLMMEMRSHGIAPTSISYNILLSCLGKTRRVKESRRVLDMMKNSGCCPDWVSYYLVARVLYLSGRFGKGNQIVDEMIEQGLVPDRKFYYDLIGILCGVERVNFAMELFERMKKSSLGGYDQIYDLLIPKLCRGGDFEKARDLWDEAEAMGTVLLCSKDVLDPSITEVFKPMRNVEEVEVSLVEPAGSENTPNYKQKGKNKRHYKKKQKKKKVAARN